MLGFGPLSTAPFSSLFVSEKLGVATMQALGSVSSAASMMRISSSSLISQGISTSIGVGILGGVSSSSFNFTKTATPTSILSSVATKSFNFAQSAPLPKLWLQAVQTSDAVFTQTTQANPVFVSGSTQTFQVTQTSVLTLFHVAVGEMSANATQTVLPSATYSANSSISANFSETTVSSATYGATGTFDFNLDISTLGERLYETVLTKDEQDKWISVSSESEDEWTNITQGSGSWTNI